MSTALDRTIGRAAVIGLLCVIVFMQAPAGAQDVLRAAFPERPEKDIGITKVRATLLGYDPNFGPYVLAPYFIVRFGEKPDLVRVFMAYDTKIDGNRFFCPRAVSSAPAPTDPICPHLPSAVAARLPLIVDLVIWKQPMLFQPGGDVTATDSVTTDVARAQNR